tara:strand:+ start:1936 stop:3618 length:1683 start_codon:yes stop_codon:yes gene_type:complete
MSQLNSLLESSAAGWKSVQSDAARLASKWERTGLLEGMGTEVHKNNMSMILENQAKQLVVEQSSTNQGGGTFNAGQGAQWAGVALPLVRKVFGQIAAKEFVSVQPMNLPSGLVFFLDFQYGQDKELNFGPAGDVYQASSSLYGNTNPGAGADPSDGLYGAGRFAYSINQFSASVAITVATSSWSDVDYDAERSASISSESLTTVTVSGGDLTRPDYLGARAFLVMSGSDVNTYFQPSLDLLLPEYTAVSGTDIKFVFNSAVASSNVPNTGNNVVFYNMQPTDNQRGDFEDQVNGGFPNAESATNTDDPLAIPSIDIKMKSEAIVAKTRKLKAQWTPEFAQDLNAYQALDAEAELTSIMSEYISLEIDLEILDMLIQDASAADEYWNVQNNQALNSGKTGYTDLGFYNSQGQWFQTLGTKLQKVSNKIHQKTLRGGANFMVISPTVATVIESIPGFASNSDGDASKAKFAFGIQKMGQMNSRYDVYKNPYMTENVILMGYRGSQFLETGAVFAPYIPLIMTPLVYDPDTFTPRKGLLTRYAKKMIRPEFYGRVFVSNTALI